MEKTVVFWKTFPFDRALKFHQNRTTSDGKLASSRWPRKNWVGPNKYDISSRDRIVIFHWENQGNLWYTEICLIRSYADSLLRSFTKTMQIQYQLTSTQVRSHYQLTQTQVQTQYQLTPAQVQVPKLNSHQGGLLVCPSLPGGWFKKCDYGHFFVVVIELML